MLVYQRVGVFLIPKTSEIQTMQLVADSTLFFREQNTSTLACHVLGIRGSLFWHGK